MTDTAPIVFLTGDLLFSSRIGRGASVALVANPAEALAHCEQGGVRLVILDLTLAALDLATLVPALHASSSAPQVLAYGPHVQVARLEAATAAGCDKVLTRGQFNAQMTALLASYAAE